MENSFAQLLSPAKEILIILPNKPYLDQVASSLSILLALKKQQKQVSINCSSPMTVEFSRLVGVTNITKEMGNKNLVIKFTNYSPENIEQVNYDIDESNQFKLTVSPKAGLKAPEKSQIDLNYSGISADLAILIGGANESHFDLLKNDEVKKLNLVHIGTRLLEVESDIQVLSFARPSSSTSEIVFSLLKEAGFEIDGDIATNLLSGIEDGSRNFQVEGVTADTFTYFAELLKMGGRRLPKITPQRYPQGSIPNKPYTTRQPLQQNTQVVSEVPHIQMEEDIPLPETEPQDIPDSWSEPKIFTGTNIS